MNKTKKLLALAFAAVAVTTASFALSSEALAKGGGHGGGGRHGGGYHYFYRGSYAYTPYVVDSCWRWYGGERVWVCTY